MLKLLGILIASLAALLLASDYINQSKFSTDSAVKVLVETVKETGHGSGVHIGGGFILTAAHTLKKVPEDGFVRITRGVDQDIVPAKIRWVDKKQDLALLSMETDPIKLSKFPAAKVSCTGVKLGQKLTIVGWPMEFGRLEETGLVASEVQHFEDFLQDANMIVAPILPGNSGGPAFDSQGKVVGLINAMVEGTALGFMVPLTFICPLLPAISK